MQTEEACASIYGALTSVKYELEAVNCDKFDVQSEAQHGIEVLRGRRRAKKTLLESLATVLEHGLATASDRQRRLIQYLVTEELEGRGDRLKAISIATDVLGRSADFNPQTDSIVRVEMGRIRQTLELYYATLGQNDPVQIKFEKRGSGGACGWSQRRFWSQCLPAAHFGFFPIWQDTH